MSLRMVCVYKTISAISLFIAIASACSTCAQQSEPSAASFPAWNDNSLIGIQKIGGDLSAKERRRIR